VVVVERDTETVSSEHVEAARRLHEAFNRTFTDGTEDLFELLDAGIEWIPINAALEGRSYQREVGSASGSTR
jgi:hypothetical protein